MTAADLFEHGIRPLVLTTYCGGSGGDEALFAGTRTLESLIGKNNICHEPVTNVQDLENILAQAESSAHTSAVASAKKAQTLVDMLYQKGWRISFAESCTGGRAAAGIIDIASASTVFDASFVTYANEAKIQFLGVAPETIAQHGVVSEPVAAEMAIGAAREAGAQVGVGISGIAGPGGATATKPVGMVCFGFYVNGKTCTKTVQFGAIGRNAVRQASVDFVYSTLIELLSRENGAV
ncbi:MAG: CinA family protein [Oscillospiraceae bacterium]|nr:CinA family protein [Oscillospiraceae bacterium]